MAVGIAAERAWTGSLDWSSVELEKVIASFIVDGVWMSNRGTSIENRTSARYYPHAGIASRRVAGQVACF
jgi:hypothetical protein